MSEKIKNGAAKVEEMRAENQLGFIFDNINIGKVMKEREQIINFSINSISSYLKSGIESPRILLVKRTSPDMKRSPEKNSRPSFKLKYIQNKSVEINLESTRIMFSDESYPKIKALIEDLPKRKENKNQTSKSPSSKSQPLEIRIFTKNLSLCVYNPTNDNSSSNGNGGGLAKSHQITRVNSESQLMENIIILNLSLSSETYIKLSPNAIRVCGDFSELSLSLTPKKTKHLAIAFREDYMIFPTRFNYEFDYSTELGHIDLKKLSLSVIFIEEVRRLMTFWF